MQKINLTRVMRSAVGGVVAVGMLVALACGASEEATPTPTVRTEPTPTATPLVLQEVATPTVAAPGATSTPTPTPASTEQPQYGGSIRMSGRVRSVDIGRLAGTGQDFSLISNVYSKVLGTDLNDRRTLIGEMAESWSASADGTVYKYTIRDGIVDHEGEAYGAEDIAYVLWRWSERPNDANFRRIPCFRTAVKKDAAFGVPMEPGGQLGVEVSGPNEITVRLNAPFAWWTACLAQGWAYLGPAKYFKPIDESGEWRELDYEKGEWIGTGPFKVVKHVDGSETILERHEQYMNEGRPYLDEVINYHITEVSSQVAAFRAGQIDGWFGYSGPTVKDAVALKREFGDEVVVPKVLGFSWEGFVANLQRPPLGPQDDPTARKIRWAIQLYLDRERYGQLVLQGSYYPSYYYLYIWDWLLSLEEWQQMPGFNPNKKAEDQAEAKRIMEELGYGPDNPLTFEIVTSSFSAGRRHGELLVEDLEKIHIKPTVRVTQSGAGYEDQLEGRFDVLYDTTGYGLLDPEIYDGNKYLPFEEYKNENWGRWRNNEWIALYEQQSIITDKTQRGVILRQMVDIIHQDSAFFPTVVLTPYHMFRGNWRDWSPQPIHVLTVNFENLWFSSDAKALPETLQQHDIFVRGDIDLS